MRTGSPDEIAWHEAGHAVVARLLGARVLGLTLESDDESFGGRASVEWEPAPLAESARRSAMVALAGPLAELQQFGDDAAHEPGALRAWDADWAEVQRCAAAVERDPALQGDRIRGWVRATEALLGEPTTETLVARVADALDAHGTLDETLFDDCF